MSFQVPPSPPIFQVGTYTVSGPISVIQGTTLSVTCISSGNPTPTDGQYKWIRSGTTYYTGQTLTINNIGIESEGVFSCEVQTILSPTGGASVNMSYSSDVFVDVLSKLNLVIKSSRKKHTPLVCAVEIDCFRFKIRYTTVETAL